MATYSVTCRADLGSFNNGSRMIHGNGALWIGRNNGQELGYYQSYFKGSNASLAPYLKKNIKSIKFFRHLYDGTQPDKIGFEIACLSKTFSGQEDSKSDMPDVKNIIFSLDEDNDGIKSRYTDITSAFSKISPADFYNQLPIGFRLQTCYRYDDIPGNRQTIYGAPATYEEDDDKRPAFVFELEDFTPTVTEQIPSQGAYIKASDSNVFSVAFEQFYVISPPTVTKASFEFRDKSSQAVTTKTVNTSYDLDGRTSIEITVPAGTVSSGKDYQWRVKFTLDDGGVGEFSDWADFTTKDTIPNAPRIIAPQSAYLDGEQPITFEWEHSNDSGSEQHAYDLDYRQGGDWENLIDHSVTAQQEYTAPEGTFGAGQLSWRVRTYNMDDIAGEYSSSDPSVVSAPPKPPAIISITAVPRATIKWSSVDQQAYQLVIKKQSGEVVEDSGAVFGGGKERKIRSCLSDGVYVFALRIQNGQGDWSSYTSSQVQIVNSPTGSEQITADPITGAVRIMVGILEDGQQPAPGTRYVLRDEIPIAKITGNSYEDYLAAGSHAYKLRVVADDGSYYDSNAVTAAPKIKYAFIAPLEAPKELTCLKYSEGAYPEPQKQITKNMTEHFFAGRSLPVYDITDGKSITWNYKYSFLNSGNYAEIERLLTEGSTVIIRDNRGNRCIGVIQDLKKSGRVIAEAEVNVSEVEFAEGIPYD